MDQRHSIPPSVYSLEQARAYKQIGIEGTYALGFDEAARQIGDIRDQTWIDFGTGTGRSAQFLKHRGAGRVFALDCNLDMLTQAQPASGVEYYHIKDLVPAEISNQSVDGAFSANVFIEIRTLKEMQSWCSQIASKLKPGGSFIIITTNPEAGGHNFKSYSYDMLQSGNVAVCTVKSDPPIQLQDTLWAVQDYIQILEASGFRVEGVSYPPLAQGEGWLDETKVAPQIIIKAIRK